MRPFILISFALPYSLFAADWPQFRGPQGDGVVREDGLRLDWPQEGLPRLWSVPAGGGEKIHAGAAAAGGKVYLPGRVEDKDALYCFDAANGKELWKHEYPAPGKGNWGAGARCTPALAGGRVYALGRFGHLVCLDAEKGDLLWTKHLVEDLGGTLPPYGIAASPAVHEGKVFVAPGGKGASLAALDAQSGETVWKAGDDAAGYAAPQLVTLHGIPQVLAFPVSGLAAYDPASGKELWRFAHAAGADRKNIAAPLCDGERVYVCNNRAGFAAAAIARDGEAWKAESLWQQPKQKMHFSSPVLGDGAIYFFAAGQLRCIGAADGEQKWALSGMGLKQAQILLLGGKHLLVLSDHGLVHLVEDQGGQAEVKARFQALAAESFAMPAVSDKRLFLRDYKNLVCFDLSAP